MTPGGRKGLLTPELTVNLSYSGTATRGVDYNAPAAVTVPAGTATANLVLTPINDQDYEGDETATNIAGGTGYTIGTPSSIDATVVDDDPPPGTVCSAIISTRTVRPVGGSQPVWSVRCLR